MNTLIHILQSIQNHNPILAGLLIWLLMIIIFVNAIGFVCRTTPKPPRPDCDSCSHPHRKGY